MKTKDDYNKFLSDVRSASGIESLTPDESGLVSVRLDELEVEVATLPSDASKAVYRDLLVGGLFGKETAGGYFAVEPESESVVYNYFFDLEEAAKDVEEFIHTIEKILQLCEIWAERIRRDLSGEEAEGTSNDSAEQPAHFQGSMIRA